MKKNKSAYCKDPIFQNYRHKGLAFGISDDGKIGLRTSRNKWKIEPIFQEVGLRNKFFDDQDFCRVKINNLFGFINVLGEFPVFPLFHYLNEFDSNDYCLAIRNRRFGFINREGLWIIPPMCDVWFDFNDAESIPKFDECDYLKASLNGKYGFINRKGIWIIPPLYESLGNEFNQDDLCIAEFNSKIGFIDRKGNWAISPRKINLEGFKNLNK